MTSALYSVLSRLPIAALAARPASPYGCVASFRPIWTSLQAPLEQTQLGDTVYNLVYSRNQTPTLGQHSHWETSGQSRKHGLSRQQDSQKKFESSQIGPAPRWLYFLLNSRGAVLRI